RLAQLPNIVGVKDATNDLARPLKMRVEIDGEFSLLSGEDATAVAYIAQGGNGVISVTANVAPGLCSEMHEAWQRGDVATVRRIKAGEGREAARALTLPRRRRGPLPLPRCGRGASLTGQNAGNRPLRRAEPPRPA